MQPIEIRSHKGKVASKLLRNFEATHEIKLPSSYITFICNNDSPWLVRNIFKFKNIFEKNYLWNYQIVDGTDERDVSFHSYEKALFYPTEIEAAQDFDVYGHPHVVAFGCTAQGDHVCFDYRYDPQTDEPHVVLMFHDAYDASNKMLICHVANSFEEFMDSLYKYEDEG